MRPKSRLGIGGRPSSGARPSGPDLRWLVGARGFEPPTTCAQGVSAPCLLITAIARRLCESVIYAPLGQVLPIAPIFCLGPPVFSPVLASVGASEDHLAVLVHPSKIRHLSYGLAIRLPYRSCPGHACRSVDNRSYATPFSLRNWSNAAKKRSTSAFDK